MAAPAPSHAARRTLRRLQQRFGALAVASALIGTSVPAVAFAAPSQEEVARLYSEGQDYMEAKDYKRAAETFTRLLNLVDESGDNQAIRESLILNILDAHIQAYEGIVDAEGNRDVKQLEMGKSTLQAYYADFQKVHGDSVAVLGEIQTMAAKLDKLLEEAQQEEETTPVPVGDGGTGDGDTGSPQPQPQPTAAPPADNGMGLLIGGVALGALGIGAAVMIPLGSVLGNTAEEDYNAAQQEFTDANGDATLEAIAQGKIDDANDDGRRANAVLISGAVLAPLLIGGSVALIVLGVKKRKKSQGMATRPVETLTAAPAFGRGFSGFSLQGRF
ncbi:MAG: hypothetical protein AAGA54_16810 [Myxococcota bacterium]